MIRLQTSLHDCQHGTFPVSHIREMGQNGKPHLSRYKNFFHRLPCAMKSVRYICILTAGDLPLLNTRKELFANKFHDVYSSIALECLDEQLYNRTRDQTLGKLHFDVTYYEKLPFLKYIL